MLIYNYKYSQQNIMDFDFPGIRTLCCRSSQENQQQKNQEHQIHRYQAPTPKHPQQITHIQNMPNSNLPSGGPRSSNYEIAPGLSSKTTKHTSNNAIQRSRMASLNHCPQVIIERVNSPITKAPMRTPIFHMSPISLNLTQPLSPISSIKLLPNNLKQVPRQKSPRITFTLKERQVEGRAEGKRLKTQEEETQYSSKHSQIVFKNGNIGTQNQQFPSLVTFKKHHSNFFQNNPIFPAQNQHLEHNESINCKQVSAKYQIDHSFSNQFLNNARTIQSIVTSTEIKPKFPFRIPSIGIGFKESKISPIRQLTPSNYKQNLKHTFRSQLELSPSLTNGNSYLSPQRRLSPPPSLNISPRIQQVSFSAVAESNLFYGEDVAGKLRKSPKISVLQLNQQSQNQQSSQSEELRDVIDNNFLPSQCCSRTNSPMISINQSLKTLIQERDKKTLNFFQCSPEHSRQASQQLALLRATRKQLQRTNTIESIGSQSSQHSCIDVKFMQHMKGRRGVSRLV